MSPIAIREIVAMALRSAGFSGSNFIEYAG